MLILCLILFSLSGCRGWKSTKPPIHPNINLDFQPKIKAQRAIQHIPEHTLTVTQVDPYYPLRNYTIDESFIYKGQEKFNIYCATCHTKTGNGLKSIITKKGWVVSNILENVTYQRSDKDLYDIIENGVRTMPGYGKKLTNKEVWQIVLYVRALQKMDRATASDYKKVGR